MAYAHPEALVRTDWLQDNLGRPDLRVVDGSWYLPAQKRDAKAEYLARHLPGAVFFDIDAFSDRSSPLPHMLPRPEEFAAAAGELGIAETNHVVVYDGIGLFSAGRVWWTFRVFGHARVSILDGGMVKWLAEGRPTEAGEVRSRAADYRPRFRPELVRDAAALLSNLRTRGEQVVDARSAGRFAGSEAEPRPGLRPGHIPGSRNLPFGELVDPRTGTLLDAGVLAARFRAAGIDPDEPVTASCGSGVTAAALAFGLHLLGNERVAVYDGSWSEWGGREDLPAESGPATRRPGEA